MSGIVNSTGARSGVIGTITSAPVTAISYEEGTWTPALILWTAGYAVSYGRYTKIGNVVHASFNIDRASGTLASQVGIGNLPFVAADGGGVNTDGALIVYRTGTSNYWVMRITNNTDDAYAWTANGGTLTYNDHGGDEEFSGMLIYRTEPA